MPPTQDIHSLVPGACECVISHGRRDSADVVKLRILRWGGCPDYAGGGGGAQCNHQCNHMREGGDSGQSQRDAM